MEQEEAQLPRTRKSVSLRSSGADLSTSSQRIREFPGNKDLFPSLDNAKDEKKDQHFEDEYAAVWEPVFEDVDSQSDAGSGNELDEEDEVDEEGEQSTQKLMEMLEKVKLQLKESKDKRKVDNANKLLRLLEDTLNE